VSGSIPSRVFAASALAIGVFAAAFGFLYSESRRSPAGEPGPGPQALPGPQAELLSERIQVLIDLLAERDTLARPASELDTPPSGAARDPLPSAGDAPDADLLAPDADLLKALARLEQVVREEARNTRTLLAPDSGERAVLERIKDADRPADWAAWAPILALWRDDPEAARAAVKLLTDQEVLDRFGTPTDVWSVEQGITWQYARDKDPVDGGYGTEIILRVPKGYVTQLAVRGRDW
jgi:hypothetical protein